MPQIAFVPAQGTLPAHPTILVQVPRWMRGGSFTANASLNVEPLPDGYYGLTILAERGDVAVRYIPPATLRFDKRALFVPLTAQYRVGTVLSLHTAQITDVWHSENRGCPSWNEIVVETAGDAIALRYDWSDGAPPSLVPAGSGLGYSNCGGPSFQSSTLRDFELVALFADGTERTLGRSSLMLDNSSVRLPIELRPEPDRSNIAGWLAGVALVVLAGATLLIKARV